MGIGIGIGIGIGMGMGSGRLGVRGRPSCPEKKNPAARANGVNRTSSYCFQVG
ncbi:hypothetical protein [Lentisalinibacter sediminis]|uniref:hypothetical protein n=1 Tax=Lentisalinibacter sediminis TaxID=2992237 RepID=UPI0038655447